MGIRCMVAVLAVWLWGLSAASQAATLSGTVISGLTGEPLSGVSVTAAPMVVIVQPGLADVGTASSTVRRINPSNRNGVFRLTDLPASDYYLILAIDDGIHQDRYYGGSPNDSQIHLAEDETLDLGVIELEPYAIALHSVTLNPGEIDRRGAELEATVIASNNTEAVKELVFWANVTPPSVSIEVRRLREP